MTRNDDNDDKLKRLKAAPNLNELERRRIDGMFPVISDAHYEAATEGYFALAAKYQMTPEDLECLMKGYALMFYRHLAVSGFSAHPLPPTASDASAAALRARRQSQNEWAIERLADVRDRLQMPAYEAKVLWYAVSDEEYQICRAAFYAMTERYGIPKHRQQQLRECITTMLFWMLSGIVVQSEVEAASNDPKVKWQ